MIKRRHRFNFFVAVKFLLIILATFGVLPVAAQTDTLRLSLDDCITMARRQSIDAAVALGELRSAYWQWRSYRADLLPEMSLSGTAPSWNKRYSSYQQADGSLSFVRNDYLGLDGAVNITQKLWPTGGTLSVKSSLDYLHQSSNASPSGGGREGANQFMSLPVAVTLSQPLFSVNHLKWNRRIEPLRYREAQARFLTETEQVAMQAISLYFGLLLAGEQVNIARQNLQTAEKLYEVAQAKRRMGTISENDVLQLRLDVLTARSALTNSESTRQARQFALRSFLDIDVPIVVMEPKTHPLQTQQTHPQPLPVREGSNYSQGDNSADSLSTPLPHREGQGVGLLYEDVLAHALQNNALATTMRRRQMEADYAVASARANRQSINLYAQLGYTGTGENMNSAYRNLLSNEVVQVGITVPLLDWGKRKGQRRMAESNRDIIQGQLRQQSQDFRQNIFILTEQFNNQAEQLRIACEADTIARRRYHTNVETFKIGSISTLELSDAQKAKDQARIGRIQQLFNYWYYYYQLRSIALWDFERGCELSADIEKLISATDYRTNRTE
ncbi:MAG: TolC family protein [Prevotella sp.]|nr:TolC family protein [Prevotella sp.]